MILLEGNVGSLSGIGNLILMIMFGPAIFFAIIGLVFSLNKMKKAAKILYILAVVYLVISLGFCGLGSY